MIRNALVAFDIEKRTSIRNIADRTINRARLIKDDKAGLENSSAVHLSAIINYGKVVGHI
jgi:hypothetical protein